MAIHYLRYFIVLILFASLFYTHTIEIKQSTIKDALDKKMPLVIDKKGFTTTIHSIDMLSVVGNVVESKVDASLKVSHANKFAKLLPKKSIHITILSKAVPKLHGKYLSFEILSLKINKLITFKKVKGLLKSKLEAIKIRIKALGKFSWLASVKSITLHNDGMVTIKLNVAKWILLLLIPLFLLREIGLFLIMIYQKFISPRKQYRCAKEELHQDGTCSSTTKEAFKKDGFIAGIKAYTSSTKQCKEAYKTLKNQKQQKDGTSCDALWCGEGGCSGVDTVGSSASGCNSVSCDIGSC